MYKLESQHINIVSTLNHRMYVRGKDSSFMLKKAKNSILRMRKRIEKEPVEFAMAPGKFPICNM